MYVVPHNYVICRVMLKYGLILCFLLSPFPSDDSGEHPAAMQHNAASASHCSMSPALFLVSCYAALWTFTAIASSSSSASGGGRSWWWPLPRRRHVVDHEIGAKVVSGTGIYQRRWLNGERLSNAAREMTSRRPGRRTTRRTTTTTLRISSGMMGTSALR